MNHMLTFVTSNKAKLHEAEEILRPFGIAVNLSEMELIEIQSLSQREVILQKAREARKLIPAGNILIEDTGFYIDHYSNFPGVLGKFVIKAIGVDGIYKLLEGIEPRAHFVSMAALFPEAASEPVIFEGTCNGTITLQRTTAHGQMPFDSIFVPDGANCTFGLMSSGEKSKYSHRKKSLTTLAEWMLDKKTGENWK